MPSLHVLAVSSFVVFALLLAPKSLAAQSAFVNWETPHVHPVELTPDGTRLLAVNLPAGRLEVFDASGDSLRLTDSIAVGVDPVTVRARSNAQAWVVNHISDSVSVVDLDTGHVVATLQTDDEPCDVVFAGDPTRAFVSCSQVNRILVFDPEDLAAAPERIEILGEDPRALAVNPDGTRVYAAIFESGNNSTFLDPVTVSLADGPYDGTNPPPNDGNSFSPPRRQGNGTPPKVAHIVRRDSTGAWVDDNGADWTEFVSGERAADSGRVEGWRLIDHDLAVIDAKSLDVEYVEGLMTTCMTLAVNPKSGAVAVAGTEALNEVRFTPNLNGVFLRVNLALVEFDEGAGGAAKEPRILDLNPHLDYSSHTSADSLRMQSIGDPRAIVWNAAGDTAYVAGRGSNSVIAVDGDGARIFQTDTKSVAVAEGPTGLALDEKRGRLFVLGKHESVISVIDLEAEDEIERFGFFDPTPSAVRAGRKHNYDTHHTSGNGHVACASCHPDARTDRLAWDLGNPDGETKEFNQNCVGLGLGAPFAPCSDWHPMKGPMVTQTLQDIIGKEPFHWRGDRESIEEFNITFEELQGRSSGLTDAEMGEYRDFLASIHFPPNPYRDFDNSLPDIIDLAGHYSAGRFGAAGAQLPDGDPNEGFTKFEGDDCSSCHLLPTGLGPDGVIQPDETFESIPPGENDERHHMLFLGPRKVVSLRGLYDRVGCELSQATSLTGFGYRHDGTMYSLPKEVEQGNSGIDSNQTIADVTAFLLAFTGSDLEYSDPLLVGPSTLSQDTHAAVGAQWTLDGDGDDAPAASARLAAMKDLADAGAVGLIAAGRVQGESRGYAYMGDDLFQSDREAEVVNSDDLLALAGVGSEITLTVVPAGAETRLGVDRDLDGALDADETDLCSDPADPTSLPGAGCDGEFVRGDCTADGGLNIADPIRLLTALFLGGEPPACRDACDFGDNGVLGLGDAIQLLSYLFQDGAGPAEPAAGCGADPTPDLIDCAGTPACTDG